MKKQLTQKLVFSKSVVTELNNNHLLKINGGTGSLSPLGCTFCINSSNGPGNISIFQENIFINEK